MWQYRAVGRVENRYTVMFWYDLQLFIVYWAEPAAASPTTPGLYSDLSRVCPLVSQLVTLVTIYIIVPAFSFALSFKTKENKCDKIMDIYIQHTLAELMLGYKNDKTFYYIDTWFSWSELLKFLCSQGRLLALKQPKLITDQSIIKHQQIIGMKGFQLNKDNCGKCEY